MRPIDFKMFAKSLVVLALLATYVAAQGTLLNSTIDPTTVDATTKGQWCASEIDVCGDLCGGNYTSNTCNSTSLDYTCLCNNGTAPGLQYYTGSLDTFICEYIYSECIVAAGTDSVAQNVCVQNANQNCGVIHPNNDHYNATSTSTTSSAAPAATSSSVSATPKSKGLTTGAKAGIGIGASLGGILAIAGIAYFLHRAQQRKKYQVSTGPGLYSAELGGEGKPIAELEDGQALTVAEQAELIRRRRLGELDSNELSELVGGERAELEARRRQGRDIFEMG
jgi:hypothetical protein